MSKHRFLIAAAFLLILPSVHADYMSSAEPHPGQSLAQTVADVEFSWRWIPGGTFTMGSPADELGRWTDETLKSVTVDGFWIAETEVTQKQFAAFVAATKYETDAEKGGGSYAWTGTAWTKQKVDWRNSGGDDYPVGHVSWNDAVAFTKWLSEETGMVVRLPSEEEWERAARGETSTSTYEGNLTHIACEMTPVSEIAWFCGNSAWKGQPVGQKQANLWWLHDVLGNVWEWTSSSAQRGDKMIDGKVLVEPGDSTYVIRGGSWFTLARDCRAAMRKSGGPGDSVSDVGFRVSMVAKPSS